MNDKSDSDLRKEAEDWLAFNFPKLFDLYQRSNKDAPKNYFNFKELFPIAYLGAQAYREIEQVLSRLDSTAWEKLSKKALAGVTADDPTRRYHQLFNLLNEARGYAHLLDEGYTHIEFIEDLTGKSPDLFARKNNSTAILEVKTMNPSDEDIKNESLCTNDAIQVDPKLSEKFKTRIKRNIRDAREQLECYQNSANRKIIFLFIYMESSQRICGESYAELKTFIADQTTKDLEIVYQASP
jgi:hypothetical protein